MPTSAAQERSQSGRARTDLRARLEARRDEIEAAALTRVRAISDPAEVSDPAYAEGLRAAVAAAVAYGIETTGREVADPPIPVALLAQARMAARVGIPLDTVLRRYFAGYSLLGYFILEEAGNAGLTDGAELKRLLGAHAGLFDRLLAAVGEEHGREAGVIRSSAGRRQAKQIEQLLAGEMVDTAGIPYDFDGWHLGLVAASAGAERRLRELVASLDCRSLVLPREGDVLWAWIGARHRPDPTELQGRLVSTTDAREPERLAIAFGEPGEGLTGWRLSHRQAAAALPVAQRGPESVVSYAEVALLATAMQDDLLSDSLRRFYLQPLRMGRNGNLLRETLRAYLDHEHNSASTAATLGVTRQAVNYRLRLIEERIGRPLAACASEIAVALRLPES